MSYDVLFQLYRKKQPKQVDLSDVLDFKSVLDSYNQNAQLPPGIIALQCGFSSPVFCLENYPGINVFNFKFLYIGVLLTMIET